jgi:hypothetical protein
MSSILKDAAYRASPAENAIYAAYVYIGERGLCAEKLLLEMDASWATVRYENLGSQCPRKPMQYQYSLKVLGKMLAMEY